MTTSQAPEPRRVVVVDDSDDIRHVLRLALGRQADLEVVAEAADGAAGVATVIQHQPDLVLLDIALPVMDGLQALQAIRQDSPDSIVIMLTALPEEAAAVSAAELRAHGYIRKGMAVPEMLDRIRQVLELQAHRRAHVAARAR